jgi:hypothetical protein
VKVFSHRRPCLLTALLLVVFTFATRAAELSAQAVAAELDSRKGAIAAEVTARLSTNLVHGSYTTVWRQFEDAAIDALCEILPKHIVGLNAKKFDRGTTGREKNRLADLAIVCGTNVIEVSIKAAQRTGNPENDMGTFRDHPKRDRQFSASFTLWVRYESEGENLRAERAFFDRTWRFVGKSSLVDGVKYRKKDGNMRPKPWAMFDSGQAYWPSEAEFASSVKRAEAYRANELVKEYLTDLSEDDQHVLLERLKEKFESGAPPAP